jgi:hypothetical protein
VGRTNPSRIFLKVLTLVSAQIVKLDLRSSIRHTMFYKRADFINVLKFKRLGVLSRRVAIITAMARKNFRQRRQQRPNRRLPKRFRTRNRGYALEEFDHLPPTFFRAMFRMDRSAFEELEEEIRDHMPFDMDGPLRNMYPPIPLRTRLAVTLRFLAGGIYIDICFAWGISKTSFFSDRGAVWPTIEAIDKVFTLKFPIDDRDALKRLEVGFREHSNGAMVGLVTVIDGLCVRVRQPYPWEALNTREYCCRKGGFAVIVIAGADADGKFTFGTCNHPGSTNDILGWETTALYKAIADGELNGRYTFGGDEAFTCTEQMISPWPGRGLDRWKDSFNYWLSHSRQAIERAFGMLTKRWGIYWRKFTFAMDRWALVNIVCMKLHNYCFDKKQDVNVLRRFEDDMEPGDAWVVIDNNDAEEDAALRQRAVGDRRRNLTTALKNEGRGRPPHANINSRCDV